MKKFRSLIKLGLPPDVLRHQLNALEALKPDSLTDTKRAMRDTLRVEAQSSQLTSTRAFGAKVLLEVRAALASASSRSPGKLARDFRLLPADSVSLVSTMVTEVFGPSVLVAAAS